MAFRTSLAEHHRLVLSVGGVLEAFYDPAVSMLADALVADHRILFCGNGGSACDAMHLAAELVVRFVSDRKAYPAISLSADPAVLTAAGNDYGYEQVFARQVHAHGRPGDVLVAISTSGKSLNVIEAVLAARHRGMMTLGLSGAKGLNCDIDVVVPSIDTARIQEMHIMIGHLLIEGLEARLPR